MTRASVESRAAPWVAAPVRSGLVLVAGVMLMTLAAKTQIPFWPVPMTLHTLAMMAFAVLLGPRAATAIMMAYLAAGATGMPVFANAPERGIGLAYMVGPTGGYLLGYLLACPLVGELAKGRGTLGRLGAMLVGLVPIYGLGMIWLMTFLPSSEVIAAGFLPFILGDLVKVLLVAAGAALVSTWWRGREGRTG